jgi:hypothetical protein
MYYRALHEALLTIELLGEYGPLHVAYTAGLLRRAGLGMLAECLESAGDSSARAYVAGRAQCERARMEWERQVTRICR